ncbi:aspartate kinase [Flammeovirga kamogawensis]|uniref:Aspartokinase n=1 Tax=Flammeovirga kamogawensis TaxID=373891 RepID=A0ABX8GX12_9BACT|nr:aspartate kinase [Flammeovirga kamogawensis]MBB6460763.1 aspartate kinase [Flammeovirga kamogawensis]QWG08116.1 aspartate kinase [Flammeovirga kamogawensis]TRX69919.1 aspartate kinase [Flammeovirga kamogawensis]
MQVFKFGGASVKDADAVRNVKNIIKDFSEQKELVVVVSAMGKTTNLMEKIVVDFLKGNDPKKHLEQLKTYHTAIAKDLFENEKASIFTQIEKLVYDLEIRLSLRVSSEDELYDQVVCYGELLSTHIISAYLNQEKIDTHFLDSRIYIQTDDNFREGNVDWNWTSRLINSDVKDLIQNNVVVTQGFIGGTINNKTTTLGREGSDFTAAIFGYCLDAEKVCIWKDVPGIMSSDPRRVEEVSLFKKLPYKYAAELTYYGASVIHPKTIRPLALKNIPLYVNSFINPADEGTVIGDFEDYPSKSSIIFKTNQAIIRFCEKDFLNVSKGDLGLVFSELSRLNIKINLMKNSALSLSICTNNDLSKIEKIKKLFDDKFKIEVIEDLELITIKNHTEDTVKELGIDLSKVHMRQISLDTYQLVIKS